MKKDLSKGRKDPLPESISTGQQQKDHPVPKRNVFLSGLAALAQAIKKKRYISIRRKRTNKDGSVVETEIVYRDDC